MNLSSLQIAQDALKRVIEANPAKYQSIVDAYGKTKGLRGGSVYFGKKLATNTDLTSIIDVIKTTDPLQEGIRNIDKGKLADGQIFVAMGISLIYANAATSGVDVDQVFLTNKVYSPVLSGFVQAATADATQYALPVKVQRIPTKVLNADIHIFRGNNEILAAPVQDFMKENDLDQTEGLNDNNTSRIVYLKSPIVYDSETAFKVQLKMPINGSAGALDHFIKVCWHGYLLGDV